MKILKEIKMYINYDNNHLQAALEVIMEKIAIAKKQEEYELSLIHI